MKINVKLGTGQTQAFCDLLTKNGIAFDVEHINGAEAFSTESMKVEQPAMIPNPAYTAPLASIPVAQAMPTPLVAAIAPVVTPTPGSSSYVPGADPQFDAFLSKLKGALGI